MKKIINRYGLAVLTILLGVYAVYQLVNKALEIDNILLAFFVGFIGVIIFLASISIAIFTITPRDMVEEDKPDIQGICLNDVCDCKDMRHCGNFIETHDN